MASLAVAAVLAAVVTLRAAAPPPEPPASAVSGGVDIASVDVLPEAGPSSRAPVSLRTRAAAPTNAASTGAAPTGAAPTRAAATPAGRPTERPGASSRPPTTSPKPVTPRPGELTPLPASREGSLRSTSGGSETFIDFVNARGEPVIVYWLDYGGNRRQYAALQPRQSYRQHTYVGHPWVVTDGRGRGLVCFQPARTTATATIR